MVFRIDYDKLTEKVRITVNGENPFEYDKIESIDEIVEVLESYIKHEI